MKLSSEEVRVLRMRGQGLVAPVASGPGAPVAVTRQVCGLQAQDIFAATLGVRVRSAGCSAADVDRQRFEERSVVWTWAMRGTLHMLAADDVDWLISLLGPVLVAAAARRRRELGLDDETYERGLTAVREHLAEHGPSTREELVEAFAGAGVKGGYSIERHLLYRAALEGIICMGPDRGTKPTFVLVEDWLGRPLAQAAPETAVARLAGRYLAAYGPATPADLAAWSGLPAAMLRPGWDASLPGLAEVSVEGRPAWLPSERLAELDESAPDSPYVRLLPAFDTYLLGHRSRDLIVDPAFASRINAGGGMIRAVVLVDGHVEGTWQSNRKGRRVNIKVEPFTEFTPAVQAGIDAEVVDIARFLGTPH